MGKQIYEAQAAEGAEAGAASENSDPNVVDAEVVDEEDADAESENKDGDK